MAAARLNRHVRLVQSRESNIGKADCTSAKRIRQRPCYLPLRGTAESGPTLERQVLVAESSVAQAVVAVGECLIQIRQLVDARKPYPAWSQNPPAP